MADEKGRARGFNNFGCQHIEVVYCLHAFDLGEQSVDEAEVAGSDPDDGRDGGRVCDAAVCGVGLRGEASGQDCGEFIRSELAVLVGEADPAVELRVASEAFLDPGHADQDDAHVAMVEIVADLLEAGGLESVGFVDDE